jgi:Fe-S cluster assembly ATP-binding protein
MPLLQLTNVTLLRENTPVCSGVSLVVAAGEVVHVRGANGAGKSTLLAGVMGLPDVSLLGEATFLGEPLLGAVHERAQQGISLVFQQPVALPGVTVLGMLRAMRVGPTGEAVGYGVLLAEVRPLLARLALPEEVLERQVHVDFSGGERKMLELLFLLWARPKLALVDEVEAGLDGEHRALALRILSDLRSAGAGILLVSHDSAFAEALQPTREMVLV